MTHHGTSVKRIIASATVALALSACSDATGPSDSDSQTVVANGPALGSLISGESARILPTVARTAARDDVADALDELTAALQAGLGNESRAAIARFNTVVDQFVNSTDNPDIAAEMAALKHSVEVVREAVETK
jgi:hypothetical protein